VRFGLLVLMSRTWPVVLPENVMPDMRKAAAVGPLFVTPTSNASPVGCTAVVDCPAPITLTFWLVHRTGLAHVQMPAGI
jgi:hypothetical protein